MPFWDIWFKSDIEELKAKRDINGLIKALGYKKNSAVRRNAAKALGTIGDVRAVEPLIARLKDDDDYVRQASAEALGQLGDVRAVEPLIAALNLTTGQAAVKALGSISDARAVEPLIAVLKYPMRLIPDWKIHDSVEGRQRWVLEAHIQKLVAETLVKIGQPSVEKLITILDNPDQNIRSIAAKTLGEIGDPQAVEPLIAALGHTDHRFGGIVAEALAKIGDSRAIDPLLVVCSSVGSPAANALTSLGWEPSNNRQKVTYLVALQKWDELIQLGQPAVEALISLLNDANKEIRSQVVQLLGKIGGLRAVEALILALKDTDNSVIAYATQALGKLEDIRAVEPMITLLQKDSELLEDSFFANSIAEALGKLANVQSLEILLTIAQNASMHRRLLAIRVLGQAHEVKAILPIVKLYQDHSFTDDKQVQPIKVALTNILEHNINQATTEDLQAVVLEFTR